MAAAIERIERLDHLGIVAGICQEIGVAAWLDAQAPTSRQQISIGTATVAMILNGLGFSNRQLYLVPQFFANKPVEHLLGGGIQAEQLNDDCLGRTLDWIADHDPTRLFAGLAQQARRIFGVQARQIHVDTTSFSVSGAYEQDDAMIAITYGYSRDHRADLKQWMLALGTTQEGAIPLFLQPLDGNSADKHTLLAAVEAIQDQLRESAESDALYVADSGIYSSANMRRLNEAGILWVSRVPETSTAAQQIIELDAPDWQEAGQRWWYGRQVDLPQGRERWIVVRTQQGEDQARATLQRRAQREREQWTKRLWHLSKQDFACEADATTAVTKALRQLPAWMYVEASVSAHARYRQPGRPRKDAVPAAATWRIEARLEERPELLEREARRRACFIVGTNVLDATVHPDEAIIASYGQQGGVERGFRFLKDPLFLASSVFVKKPTRVVGLSFIMVLCLLIYRLAEQRLRSQLAATGQTLPNQIKKPTTTPTMRWIFQLFEGIHLLSTDASCQVYGLQLVHQQILRLLGSPCQRMYLLAS